MKIKTKEAKKKKKNNNNNNNNKHKKYFMYHYHNKTPHFPPHEDPIDVMMHPIISKIFFQV